MGMIVREKIIFNIQEENPDRQDITDALDKIDDKLNNVGVNKHRIQSRIPYLMALGKECGEILW